MSNEYKPFSTKEVALIGCVLMPMALIMLLGLKLGALMDWWEDKILTKVKEVLNV